MNLPAHKTTAQNHTFFVSVFPSSFTGKERDEETGYGYFGARYMDHELMTMWLSVDPLADKYPSISPYSYCAWNPVKLVDFDGREVGDYYTLSGSYLGWDGIFDNKIHIVDGKTSLAKDEKGFIDANRVTPLVSTTYEVLAASIDVFEKTKGNGGSKEEATAVLAGRICIQGNSGYTGVDGNPHCDFPNLKEDKLLLGVTSIQSHPFTIVGEDNYRTVTPSADDKTLFGSCDLNIIIGYVSSPTPSSIFPNSTENIGAAFINNESETLATISMRSIVRIVNNRQNANNKHWDQILSGL